MHDLLADRRRRLAIEHLLETGEPTSLRDLAAAVAAEGGADAAKRASVERTAVALRHAHLPRLEAAGVAEYDPETDEVTLTDRAAQIAPALDVEREYETERPADPGPPLAALGIAAAALSAGGVPGASALDPVVWAVGALACIAVVGLGRDVLATPGRPGAAEQH